MKWLEQSFCYMAQQVVGRIQVLNHCCQFCTSKNFSLKFYFCLWPVITVGHYDSLYASKFSGEHLMQRSECFGILCLFLLESSAVDSRYRWCSSSHAQLMRGEVQNKLAALFLEFTDESWLLSPGWCGLVDWVSACEPNSHWFDSQSGHMPGLWARSLVRGTREATHIDVSLPLFHPSPLSKNK